MRFPTLTIDSSLGDIRSEVRYTLAVLRHRPWASVHVPTFEALLKEIGQLTVAQDSLFDKVEDANAGFDEADRQLDIFVESTATDAGLATNKDTDAPLWRSLFGNYRPSELQRLKLGAELEQVRAWPDQLRAAPTPALRDRAARCGQLISAADEATKAQGNARSAVQLFKVSTIEPFLAKLNAERSGLAGAAEKLAFSGQIQSEAAQGLFRSSARGRAYRPQNLANVQADLTASEQETARLQQLLATLQGEQTEREQAAERRRADQEALRTLQATQAAGAKQIAELEKRLR